MVDKVSNNNFGKFLQLNVAAQNSSEKIVDKINVFDSKAGSDTKATTEPLPFFALGAGSEATPENTNKVFVLLPDLNADTRKVQGNTTEQNGDSSGIENEILGFFDTNNIVKGVKAFTEKGASLLNAEATIALLYRGEKTAKIIGGLDKVANFGDKVVKSFDNFQAWDNNLGNKFVNHVENAVNFGNPKSLKPSFVTTNPAIKLNGGLIQTFVRGQQMSYTDVLGQQAEYVIEQYQLKDKAKDFIVDKAKSFKNSKFVQQTKTTFEKVSNSKPVETIKNVFKKNPTPAVAETVTNTSTKTTTTVLKAVGTKTGQGVGVVFKGLSKAAPVAQYFMAAYDLSNAAIEGFEKDGIGGAVNSVAKQGVQTGTAIATSLTAMKGCAEIGFCIGGPVGALIGGLIGAVGGFILGSRVGQIICDGLEWCGGQIICGAEKAWDGIKWCGNQIACGAEKAWDGIKEGANWVAEKTEEVWEETKRVGGKVLNAINPLNWF